MKIIITENTIHRALNRQNIWRYTRHKGYILRGHLAFITAGCTAPAINIGL